MTQIRDKAHAARVARAAELIAQRLAAFPPLGANLDDPQARTEARTAYEAAVRRMQAGMNDIAPTTIREDHAGCRIKLLGLAASATTGFAQACGNWIAQSRAKLARFHDEQEEAK